MTDDAVFFVHSRYLAEHRSQFEELPGGCIVDRSTGVRGLVDDAVQYPPGVTRSDPRPWRRTPGGLPPAYPVEARDVIFAHPGEAAVLSAGGYLEGVHFVTVRPLPCLDAGENRHLTGRKRRAKMQHRKH